MEYPVEGVKIEELEENESYRKFLGMQHAYERGFVRLMPYQQIVPKDFIEHATTIKNFQIRDDDVWISSFPKCGTTWTQEMVWCIMNNLDFETAKKLSLERRVPHFELTTIIEKSFLKKIAKGPTAWMEDPAATLKLSDKIPSPRIIKTHMSWQMLPDQLKSNSKAKIIYITRNPRDACVSFHNQWKFFQGFVGGFKNFAEAFVNDIAGTWCPFIPHVLEYWNVRNLPNVCFITYEEMKSDLAAVIRKVSSFLEHPVPEDQIQSLIDHLSFDKMKDNKAVNKEEMIKATQGSMDDAHKTENAKFMRKGETGDWKNHFTPELEKKFVEWEKRWLEGSDFKFTYEI